MKKFLIILMFLSNIVTGQEYTYSTDISGSFLLPPIALDNNDTLQLELDSSFIYTAIDIFKDSDCESFRYIICYSVIKGELIKDSVAVLCGINFINTKKYYLLNEFQINIVKGDLLKSSEQKKFWIPIRFNRKDWLDE